MKRNAGLLAAAVVLCAVMAPAAPAAAALTGGAPAPAPGTAVASSGGSATPRAISQVRKPVVRSLSFPATALPGSPPPVSFEVTEAGVATVNVTATIRNLQSGRAGSVAALGWVHTGRVIRVGWPHGARLGAGTYSVTLSVRDHQGERAGSAAAAGTRHLTVGAPAAAPQAPAVPAPQDTAPAPGAASPAQTVADGAVFPVAGPHNFGGPEDRYGAPRGNHIHEGQDVLTAEGTPVLAPLGGTITWTSYQAEGAGYYAVEHTSVGLDFMFAHCMAGSLAVSAGEVVGAGALLCHAGQTGDATAPHLHLEIWVGGWQAPGGHSIDPLPYLEAWER